MIRNLVDREKQRFSIRKYTFGAVSVLLGSILFWGQQAVLAEEEVSVPEVQQVQIATETVEEPAGGEESENDSARFAASSSLDLSVEAESGTALAETDDSDNDPLAAENSAATPELSEVMVKEAVEQTELSTAAVNQETKDSVRLDTDLIIMADSLSQSTSSLTEALAADETREFLDVADFLAGSRNFTAANLAESKIATAGSSLPSQGNYVYTKRTEIKNEPKLSAKTEFYANAGDKVFYDQVITADGYRWISYRSYSGLRRYAAVEEITAAQPQVQKTVKEQGLAAQGSYTFTKETAVKSEPKQAAPTQFVFNRGEKINYDQLVDNDGHQWLSYVSYSGLRRYVDLGPSSKSKGAVQNQTAESKVTGDIKVQNQTADGFDILITNVFDSNGITGVKVPVWTAKGGQDDLIWYDASKQNNGVYKVAVKISNHKNERGTYNINLYYVENSGRTVGVAATHTSVAAANTADSTMAKQGRYRFTKEVEVKNQPKLSAKTEFTFAVGESINYDQVMTADNYQWLSYVSYSGTRRYIPLTALTAAPVQEVQRTGTITIQNQSDSQFNVLITNVSDSKEIREVKVPVWTAKGGQDDLVWYNASKQSNGDYIATVNRSSHRNEYGTYHIHLYYVENDGQTVGIAATTTTLSEPQVTRTGSLSVQNQTSDRFDVIISNVSSSKGIKEVLVPVWTAKGGQDDLVWYSGQRQNNGDYKVTVNRSSHKGEYGEYYIHLYYVENDGQMAGVATTKTSLSEPQLNGVIAIEDKSSQGFTVLVKNVSSPKGVQAVKLPVWSVQDGQDDLIWYEAVNQNNGTYKATIRTSAHKNTYGQYNVHLYYLQQDGTMIGVASTHTIVEEPKAGEKKTVTYNGSYYSIQGKYDEILVVNKNYPLSASYNPGENAAAKAAFIRMRDDMIKQGYNVGYGYSGFRSYSTQATLYQSYVNRDGQAAADRYSARPGYSEHQTGLAYDLTDKSGNLLEDPAASQWLKHNAHKYGFVVRYQPGKESVTGFMEEPWHVRYIGQEAKEVYESGLTLEEYFDFKGGHYSSASPSTSGSLPAQGTYTFTKRSSVKAEPKISSPELAYYDAGNTVHYDKVVFSDNHQWISYIAFSGARRYIDIS